MKRSFFALLLLGLVGCNSPNPQLYPDMDRGAREERSRMQKIHDGLRAEYAARWSAFRCDKSEIPDAEVFEIDTDATKPALLPNALQLCLKLGKAIPLEAERLVFRTESRYVLKNAAGKEFARAESKLTESNQGSARVIYCAASRSMLVDEELSGAGDVSRRIAFVPESEDKIPRRRDAATWRVFYVHVPLRQDIGEGHIGQILSISDGKIFVETDGVYYGFPIKEFIESKLDFSVG